MADQLDIAEEYQATMTEAQINSIRQRAEIKPGTPGECDLCGEWSGRLIKGACAPCRDQRGLA